MEVVISISEERYKEIVDFDGPVIVYRGDVAKALRNGIKLPEHHGRLIDADAIEYDKESLETDSSQVFLVVDKDSIDLMPTIVEARKEG